MVSNIVQIGKPTVVGDGRFIEGACRISLLLKEPEIDVLSFCANNRLPFLTTSMPGDTPIDGRFSRCLSAVE